MATRDYTTRRSAIVKAIAEKLKDIDGSGGFLSDLNHNVSPRLKFWDEVEEFPAVHLNAGSETRAYQGAGYKDRFLSVTVRCYVHDEDAVEALDNLLDDVETVLEDNSSLSYADRGSILENAGTSKRSRPSLFKKHRRILWQIIYILAEILEFLSS